MRPTPGPQRIDEMLASLRAAGLKLTPQRLAIVRELAADETHPTAQELFERLRVAQPTMSFATVYNTLDALANAGLCAALSLAPGPARFDPNMRPHHHAVCDRCGLVRDVASFNDGAASGPKPQAPSAPLGDGGAGELEPQASSGPLEEGALVDLTGFEIRAVERIYRGVCAGCAQRGEGSMRAKTPLRPSRA
ncbi:MAG: transcriptional repressor [Minicystis sp.]